MAGIALCAFFALGVITGLSQSGHILARRIEALLARLPHGNRSELIPAAYHTFLFKEPTARKFGWSSAALTARGPAAEIALIEYPDGFFQIDSKGGLRSMVSSADAADLPVISGSGVETADASQLVEYAGQLIRAEAALSAIISEMHVTPSGEMHLFLERPHLEIVLAPGQLPLQLARAARVLEVWRGRRELIGVLDMTISSEAIVRPQAETMKCLDRATASRGAGRPG